MPISRWRRLRHDFFRIGQQSPRGGIIEQIGKLFDVIIHRVLSVITAIWYGPPVRAPEEPVILVVTLDRKTTLVHEFVMLRTQQHQVVEARIAAGGPVLNVVCIDKAFVVAAGERTAFVPGHEGALDCRWHDAGLTTDIQRLSTLAFTDDDRVTIAAQSFDALDREARSTLPGGECRLVDVDRDQVVIRCVARGIGRLPGVT